jgi:ubiquinone/menaquinone biosynthesis C-methylase UbiE
MVKLGEMVLYWLNMLLPEPNASLLSAKQDGVSYLRFVQQRAVSSFAAFGGIDLADKVVMDVGCGLGANLVHLSSLGPSKVVALDIDSLQIGRTKSMIWQHHGEHAPRIEYVAADGARMPFIDGSFDVLVCADTLEHVHDLAGTLRECCRVLCPGGFLHAYFPPFYAPWGAHMINWVRVPWCQVFFSESTILKVARRLERETRSINAQLPPETRLDLGDGDLIPFVNHLTLHRFLQTVGAIPEWQIARMYLLPPGWRGGGLVSKILSPLSGVPLLREMFTAKAVFTLRKAD